MEDLRYIVEVQSPNTELKRTFGYLIVAVSRDGYLFEGLNILISTFCVCADGFPDLSKVSLP